MAILTKLLQRRFSTKAAWLPWFVCLSSGLLFFYEFIQLNILNSISVELMREFHISAESLGKLSSTYFYANIGFLFLAGNLLDRYSTRKLILMAMIFCTGGTLGFGLSHNVFVAGAFRALIGVGGAFCLLSAVRLASRWFPPRRIALLTGLIVMMAMLGGWVAQVPATLLVESLGWRHMMLVNAGLGVFIIVWVWATIQDYPIDDHEKIKSDALKLKQQGVMRSINMVLKNKENWFAGLYACLLNLPIFLLGAMWGKMYLIKVNHFSTTEASFICGMLFWGSIIGSPLMGLISDSIGLRRVPMMIFSIISLLLVIPALYIPGLSVGFVSVLFFLLGLTTCSQVISYPLVTEHNPLILTGTAVSIVSMTCLMGGAVGFPFSGWLLDLGWDHKTYVHGAPFYSTIDFQHMMLILPIAFIVSLFIAFFIKETYCKSQHD